MKIDINKTFEYTVYAWSDSHCDENPTADSFDEPLEDCPEPVREAVAVAVLASLSPEARARVIGGGPPSPFEYGKEEAASTQAATDPVTRSIGQVTSALNEMIGRINAERQRAERAEATVEAVRPLVKFFVQNVPLRPYGDMFAQRFDDAVDALQDYDENRKAENRLRGDAFRHRDTERQRADDNRDAAERVGFARAEGEVIRIMRECGFTTIPGRVFTSLREALETKGAERLKATNRRLGEALRAAHEGGNPEHDPPEPDPDDSAEAIIRDCIRRVHNDQHWGDGTSADCFVTRITALVERTANQRLRECGFTPIPGRVFEELERGLEAARRLAEERKARADEAERGAEKGDH